MIDESLRGEVKITASFKYYDLREEASSGKAMERAASEGERQSDWGAASEKDIYYCYRLILDREPDAEGWAAHAAAIRSGMSVQSLAASFLNSVEFRNRQTAEDASRSEPLLVELDSFKIYVSREGSPVGRCIREARQYEPHVTAALQELLRPGMVFADVGANVGYHSLTAARLVGPQGKVFSFEPSQHLCKLLYLSARENGFENVSIYPVALADRQRLLIYDEAQGNGAVSEFDANLASTPLRQVVMAWTLDDALRGEEAVALIKMDVEGAEHLVLRGARAVLQARRPVIISEFFPGGLGSVSGVSGEQFLLELVGLGYEISVLDFDKRVLRFGDDVGKVLRHVDDRTTSHVDLLALPK